MVVEEKQQKCGGGDGGVGNNKICGGGDGRVGKQQKCGGGGGAENVKNCFTCWKELP